MQAPFISVQQARRSFYLTAFPAALLVRVAYASVRRQNEEPGAVQRVLNQSRIAGIKNFALQDGDFPASIALNWVGEPLVEEGGLLRISEEPRSAQILDGQHRVAGLGEAIVERPELGEQLIPVAIYMGLDTRECANIFLSINTEQKPVPKSLVYDLYGIASAELIDQAADRARDITVSLNESGQAYDGLIKFPNTPRRRGGVALSTAVTALKPLVTEKGVLDQIGASSLEMQRQIVQNFFSALAEKYGERWTDPSNAFLYAGGFTGAVEFLHLKMIPYCVLQGSFERLIISGSLHLEETDMIRQEEIKGLGGKDAPKRVFDRLGRCLQPDGKRPAHFPSSDRMAHLAADEVCAWLATFGDVPPTAQTIDPDAVTRVRVGLGADARGLVYSAIVSLLSAIDVAQRASFSWAVVKLYYCSFYAARSILASNGTCIFYRGTKPYSLAVAPGESPKKENGVTHKVVWSIFAREFPANALLNDIDGVSAHKWMTRLREEANYKSARFPDPIVPSAFASLDRIGVEPAMAAYRADDSHLYTFDPDHAAVAFPMSCIVQARRSLLRNGQDLDAEEADYIRRLSEHIGVSVDLLL